MGIPIMTDITAGGSRNRSLFLLPLLTAAASAATGIGGNIAANRRARDDREFSAEQAALDRNLRERQLAFEESLADPYRSQLHGANAINRLDMLERSRYEPTRLQAPSEMQAFVPQMGGGTSYSKSPEAVASFGGLKRDVIRQAQTQQRGAAGAGSSAAADPYASVDVTGYARRGGGTSGGIAQNAAGGASLGSTVGSVVPGVGTLVGAGLGAAAGAIGGLANRRAASAPTDLSVSDASDAIRRQYRQSLGREPSPQEVQTALAGQGLQPGHRWVGERGLARLLLSIASSEEARARSRNAQAPLDAYGWMTELEGR